jgi:hypothetical protein
MLIMCEGKAHLEREKVFAQKKKVQMLATTWVMCLCLFTHFFA